MIRRHIDSIRAKAAGAAAHPGFRKYLKNTSWLFATRIAALGISFFVTTYVVRYLGPANYGNLSYAVSFVSLFSFIAVLGIDQVLYRDLVKFPEKKNVYLGTAFVIKLAAGAVAAVLCVGTAYALSTESLPFLLIAILSGTFIFNSLTIIIYEFQADVDSKPLSIAALAVAVTLSLLKIAVVYFDQGVIYLALILLFESILSVSLYCFARVKKYGPMRGAWAFDKKVAASILRDSWPLIFSSAFALIYSRIDQVMIKHFIDTASVGIYDAAVRISEVWYFVPSILVSSLFPAIVNAKLHSEEEYNRRLGRFALLLLGLALAVAIPVYFAAHLIIGMLYGEAFLRGVPILQIYIWSGIGTSLALLATNYLITENYRRILFLSYLIATLSNVILNLVFIPRYGITGAAWATFVSYSLGPLSLFFFKTTRRRLFHVFIKARS